MTPAYRTAYVYVRNIFAGILSETDKGYIILYQILSLLHSWSIKI